MPLPRASTSRSSASASSEEVQPEGRRCLACSMRRMQTREHAHCCTFHTSHPTFCSFQTTLVVLITQVSGANYFSVHSPGEGLRTWASLRSWAALLPHPSFAPPFLHPKPIIPPQSLNLLFPLLSCPYSSPGEFQKRLVSQFNYSVTPLVFDLTLEIQSPLGLASEDGWRILQAYGSPNNDSTLTPDGKILSVGGRGVVWGVSLGW